MVILLTGGSGQLGTELQKFRTYAAPSHSEMDITNPEQVADVIARLKPTLILHAAANTDTSTPDHNPVAAAHSWQVNVLGTRHLVTYAKCPIIFISTESAIHPYNFYILTKIAAEFEIQQHKYGYSIVRTSFRDIPFEYPKACIDMWTLADSVPVIAKMIDSLVDTPTCQKVLYVGTGPKSVYELARKTRPDVIPVRRADVDNRLPEMNELLHV